MITQSLTTDKLELHDLKVKKRFSDCYLLIKNEHPNLLPLLEDLGNISEEEFEDDEIIFDSFIPDDSDFRIIKKIGNGGMGLVFEGIQISLNRKVAIKVLASSLLKDEEQRIQFEQEAKLIAQLHHPNIVKVLSAQCSEQFCFYAMEYIDARTLTYKRERTAFEIAHIGLSVAKALAYAHSCGIMHRDIKPSNILIDSNNGIHLCDFGLAVAFHHTTIQNETSLTHTGTLQYMSPERIAGEPEDFSSEQYALGATLYELIVGKPLYEANSLSTLKKQIERGTNFSDLTTDRALAAIIKKSMSVKPRHRYRDMNAMAEDLQHYLNHQPIQAKSYNTYEKLHLWIKRKPLAATFALLALTSAFVAAISCIIGYRNTTIALQKAETNAEYANQILEKVFSSIPKQQPGDSNKRLLASLLPYYDRVSQSKNLSKGKLYKAHEILGSCALHTGDYVTAEKAYRYMLRYDLTGTTMNELAKILVNQGKKEEAMMVYRDIVNRFSSSPHEKDRAETITALLALSSSPQSDEYQKALKLLQQLLREAPENPNYLFRYACLLAANPHHMQTIKITGVEPNATNILLKLATQYPDCVEIGKELITLTRKRILNNKSFILTHQPHISQTLQLAERLMARYPNNLKLLENILQLRDACLREYHHHGLNMQARKLTDRMLNIMEFLFFCPDSSEEIKQLIINEQIARVASLHKLGKKDSAEELTTKIREELKLIHGENRKRLLQQLSNIENSN